MDPQPGHDDRRASARHLAGELEVGLRSRGQLARTPVQALDFNRFGIGVLTDRPMSKHRQVFVTLRLDELHLKSVVGVIHNCVSHDGRYRCGIQFRTRSLLQLDQNQVERELRRLERMLNLDGLVSDTEPPSPQF